jgi:hypothetical protein
MHRFPTREPDCRTGGARSRCHEGDHDGVSSGDDHIRVAGYDLAGQIGITLVMPLGGIAFDDQIFSFDVPQAAQLGEKRAPCAPPPVSVRRVVGIAG